ncbi:MAG: phosphoglycerate dehydrogenase [Leptospirales bacterium]|jgi:D-3-phosphoglycerate dehydrogenase
MKHTIVVSDKFDAEGIARLKGESNLEVVYEGGHTREQLLDIISGAHGLIIRSATKVDEEVLAKAENLKIIIRAGVGVDNINILEASRRGVIVMNAPGGNTVSTAEQALALLFATARKTPQANESMHSGKWEKSKFKGVEVTGKTLGVVGLGRIGKEVVKRAKGLQMRVIGFDPYIQASNLASLEIDIVSKEDLIKQSDFITVHTPLTDTTRDLVNIDNLKDLKKGVRLINCARGGIYSEDALVAGLESGQIGAVALDVFTKEPLDPNHPLIKFDNAILTPHLGASTGDAEFAVAMETIDELIDFFKLGVARNALNFPTVDPDSMDFLKPYFAGGQPVGKLLGHLLQADPASIRIDYCGEISKYMTQPVTTSILCGALSLALGDEVNVVNAPVFGKDRGIEVNEHKTDEAKGFSSFVRVTFTSAKGDKTELEFTAMKGEAMVFSMFGLPLEFKPEGIVLVLKNRDMPRMVGNIGMALGENDVNIAHLELSRDAKGGTAYCVVTIDDLMNKAALEKVSQLENVFDVVQVDLR